MTESNQAARPATAGPLQMLGRALTDIRKGQNLLELNYPDQGDAIKMQREAGDLIWDEIQGMQQQPAVAAKLSPAHSSGSWSCARGRCAQNFLRASRLLEDQ